MVDGRLPDGLLLRQPEAEREHRISFAALLFLLTPTDDPDGLARRLVPLLAGSDGLPQVGDIVALWTEEDDGWALGPEAWARAAAALQGAPTFIVAFLGLHPSADAAGFVYEPLPPADAAEASGGLAEAIGGWRAR